MAEQPNGGQSKRSLVIAFLARTFLFLLIGVPVGSQSPVQKAPAGNAAAQTQPLRVTSRLVQVNVIVQDKNGQPVTGLTKDDFTER
jgi:hypothetical protein